MTGHERAFTDRYTIGELLGTGGMCRVYAGHDSLLGREVAIKIPRLSLPPTSSADHIIDEARTTASLQSEHITRVLDAGLAQPEHIPYIVMERLCGLDLERVLEQHGRIAVRSAVDYIAQVCEALAEAHAAGIVHRDIKPANIFLARKPNGTAIVKVLDFGMRREGSAFVGTPLYVAPEVVAGHHLGDARSDVWALGVVLHELISGHLPFAGQDLNALYADILQNHPQRLDFIIASVPVVVADIVEKCLSKSPFQRYASARELGVALASCLIMEDEGVPGTIRPVLVLAG